MQTQLETSSSYQIRHTDTICTNDSKLTHPWWHNFKYSAVGMLLGIVFIKAEIVSWFRIQEMFLLDSFFMFGVIGTAVVVGIISVAIITKHQIRTINGERITLEDKKFNKGHVYGGLIFGVGWALTGACPGPLFAQLGSGMLPILTTIASAVAGTWVYGYFRERLPH
jgi:uncharacterized membrane protein YedE/YeeE